MRYGTTSKSTLSVRSGRAPADWCSRFVGGPECEGRLAQAGRLRSRALTFGTPPPPILERGLPVKGRRRPRPPDAPGRRELVAVFGGRGEPCYNAYLPWCVLSGLNGARNRLSEANAVKRDVDAALADYTATLPGPPTEAYTAAALPESSSSWRSQLKCRAYWDYWQSLVDAASGPGSRGGGRRVCHGAPATAVQDQIVVLFEHDVTGRISCTRGENGGRKPTEERRCAPTSVPLRRNQCSRSPESVFHFSEIRSTREAQGCCRN